MNIEKLAFKNYFELKEIQKIDLLLIIEFLQKDRKQWINQYTQAHNDYVVLQQENQKLKRLIEDIKKLSLYDYDLDYDFEDEPVDNYFPFDMDYYIDNWFMIEELEEKEEE